MDRLGETRNNNTIRIDELPLNNSSPRDTAAVRIYLLFLYDALLIVVLISHIYVFRSHIGPSYNMCNTAAVVTFHDRPGRSLNVEYETIDKHVLCTRDICKRYNWNIVAAGSFSSTFAAILATMHLTAIVCRLVELAHAWNRMMKHKGGEHRASGLQEKETEWQVPPRDVDIHDRDTASSERTGRLTAISEEERDDADGQTGRVDLLLECLA
jgi:hypothetical protein